MFALLELVSTESDVYWSTKYVGIIYNIKNLTTIDQICLIYTLEVSCKRSSQLCFGQFLTLH